jgi:hypothetical protein
MLARVRFGLIPARIVLKAGAIARRAPQVPRIPEYSALRRRQFHGVPRRIFAGRSYDAVRVRAAPIGATPTAGRGRRAVDALHSARNGLAPKAGRNGHAYRGAQRSECRDAFRALRV